MKVIIDDENKTVEIEEDVNLDKLFGFLTERNLNFKEYKIVSKNKEFVPYPYPVYPQWPTPPVPYEPAPWEGPIVTYQTSIT